MITAARTFISNRLTEIRDRDQGQPFVSGDTGNIFFGPMPRDFLKGNPFAACCLVLQDLKRFNGRLVANVRDENCTQYTRIRKAFDRKVLYRVILYAAEFKDQWGEEDFKGFIDQLEEKAAAVTVIPDALNQAVRITLYDSIRPWDQDDTRQTIKRRSHKAIARMEFDGGIYTQKTVPIIQDVDLQPEYE